MVIAVSSSSSSSSCSSSCSSSYYYYYYYHSWIRIYSKISCITGSLQCKRKPSNCIVKQFSLTLENGHMPETSMFYDHFLFTLSDQGFFFYDIIFKLSNNFLPMLHLSNQFSFFLGRQVRVKAQHKEEILRFERNQRLRLSPQNRQSSRSRWGRARIVPLCWKPLFPHYTWHHHLRRHWNRKKG